MKTLTLYEINQLKDKKLITQVLSSQDILAHYNTVDALKEADLVTVTDPSTNIEEAVCYDYSQDYFTFDVLAAGNIEISSISDATRLTGWSYSKDGGETWVSFSSLTPVEKEIDPAECFPITIYVYEIPVLIGDSVLLKGNGPGNRMDPYAALELGRVSIAGNNVVRYNVSGNIMSLLYGDDFKNHTELPDLPEDPQPCDGIFTGLFFGFITRYNNPALVSAENLILPSTELKQYCYYGMFHNCISLTTAPVLPATTLVENCYAYMFMDCDNLRYIKCLGYNEWSNIGSNYTPAWTQGVSSTGTFVKSKDAEWRVNDHINDGIPEGWTIQDA